MVRPEQYKVYLSIMIIRTIKRLFFHLIFIRPPTRPNLTQGHFIARSPTRIETNAQPSQKNKILIPSEFLIFEAPQTPSNELSHTMQVLPEVKAANSASAKQILLERKAANSAMPSRYCLRRKPPLSPENTITPTQRERRVEPGKPGIGVFDTRSFYCWESPHESLHIHGCHKKKIFITLAFLIFEAPQVLSD